VPLYHFSEDPSIRVFEPRPPLAHPDAEPLVWAIDAWHQPMYFTPRDCPRVLFWPLPTTTDADRERFWTHVAGRMVVAIEGRWLDRLRATQMYRYVMPDDSFESLNDAGMHVSRATVVPLRVEPLRPLLDELRDAGVELRVCDSLLPLAEAITRSSLHYSLIRMRNAAHREGSTGA
jgi:hypothetical protein